MIHVYRAPDHLVAVNEGQAFRLGLSLDEIFTAEDPHALLAAALRGAPPATADQPWLAPIQSQEIWAAGVTYLRSMNARMDESKHAGGDTFYDRVYHAERPELFFKATPHRVAGPGEPVRIRRDSKWNVPEPELTLAFNSAGKLFGCTIGNDMSSRDIEGENPLYLPQAKVYSKSAGLGPALIVSESPLPSTTAIEIAVRREGALAFSGATNLGQIKRDFVTLGKFLFRDNDFPAGCYLMTGTGIVPPDDFTLRSGDEIRITIPPIGTLVNPVA